MIIPRTEMTPVQVLTKPINIYLAKTCIDVSQHATQRVDQKRNPAVHVRNGVCMMALDIHASMSAAIAIAALSLSVRSPPSPSLPRSLARRWAHSPLAGDGGKGDGRRNDYGTDV